MPVELSLSPKLKFPIDAVTQTFAILGIRGSGKTSTAVVLAEELLNAGQQIVFLDPVDVAWGLRSSATGKDSGFPITILGGDHADLPLEAAAGALLADFVVDTGTSLILSLRHMSMSDQRRFAADFAERLYAKKGKAENRNPLHLIVDEADEFIPQRLPPGGERMFGAFDRLVRRGRSSGIGVTMISQRAQVVNKDVLSQIETLICHRVLHKLDRKALEAWIEAHDVHGRKEVFMASLASLGTGDAWVWSPQWLDIFERVHIRARHTFDSSATPKAGNQPKAPGKLAPVDLDKLRLSMSEVIERAKADDPRELRKQISQLQAELKKKTGAPIIDTSAIELARKDGELSAERRLQPQIAALTKTIESAAKILGQSLSITVTAPQPIRDTTTRAAVKLATPVRVVAPSSNGHSSLSGGQRKILSVLAQYPDGRSDSQIAILTGYAVGSGNFNNLLSSLRTNGWADGQRSNLRITSAGISALGSYDPLPTGTDLRDYWYGKLGKAERAILQSLVDAYPQQLSNEEVGAITGYAHESGNFNNALSRLRTLELISGSRKDLRASENLF
ncbi:MAG TPA: DUF87 domain-containing protein [Bryobacteraceae bacterium]|nr:DUF87 domain-containing protein [Bryobacteraceae bacterium]